MKTDAIQFGDTEIRYRLRESFKRKTLAISVAGQSVEVAAPAGLKVEDLRPYVRAKAGWILAKLDENRRVAPVYPRQMQSGESLHYLGRQYLLRVVRNAPERGVKMWRGELVLKVLRGDDPKEMGEKLVKQWYREHLVRRLQSIVKNHAERLGLGEVRYEVRELGNRWGSCGKNGRLYFHWQLARLTISKIEFVCAHELVHLHEPNHTTEFRKLLARLVPHYESLAGDLVL